MSSKFISKKLIKELRSGNKFSKPIIRVSIISITISIMVMLLAVSIVKNFQKEISQKVVNFGSHIQIRAGGFNQSFESTPIQLKQAYIDKILSIEGVSHVQTFALKPGIIQSKADTVKINNDEEQIIRDIEGVIFKGVNNDFNWENLKDKIIEGEAIEWNSDKPSNKIIISKHISKKLKLNVGEAIACYFIKGNGPRLKRFIVSGIYETGLEEFDKQFTFIDIRHIQKLNDWGIQTTLFLNENCFDGKLLLEAKSFGGNKKYLYDWGKGYSTSNKLFICPKKDTIIQVKSISFDYTSSMERVFVGLADSAYIKLSVDGNACPCSGIMKYESIDDSTRNYSNESVSITSVTKNGEGSMRYYIGGYEVFLNDFSLIDKVDQEIGVSEDLLKATKITDAYREIFGWLNILNTNVVVIIVLMILVAIVNITSLLLVLIIERSNMIGLLKAFGAENKIIQRIFVSLGGYIMIRGLIIGNGLAFVIIILQKQFGLIKLPQENYFLNKVPMDFEWLDFLIINVFTIAVCYGILFLASLFIGRINPIKTIKFN